MRSLMYNSPRVYEGVIRVLHRSALDERYQTIAEKVGKNRRVLDVGCGTGLLAKYLDYSCEYYGIDLNEKFIKCAKERGLKVQVGDIFDEKNYIDSDVIVLCDILHHVIPKHDHLIEICKDKASRVVICEQCNMNRMLDRIIEKFRSIRWYHNLLGDSDGINTFDSMRVWNDFDRETVVNILRSHGISELTLSGSHIIGIIENRGDRV